MVSEEVILAEKEYLVNVLGKQLFNIDERDTRRIGYSVLASKYWPEYFVNGKILKGYHVHHIDFNHSNNVVSNLVVLTAKEHRLIHWKFDPQFEDIRESIIKSNETRVLSEETRAKMKFNNSGSNAPMFNRRHSEETKRLQSEHNK